MKRIRIMMAAAFAMSLFTGFCADVQVKVTGTGGDCMTGEITVGSTDGSKETLTVSRDGDDIYRAEWQSFIEAINGEHSPENPAESAIVATLLLQCQIDSAKAGKEVDVAEVARSAGFVY